MIEATVRMTEGTSMEEDLRAEIARGDAMAGTVRPILRHLLSGDARGLFGDEVLARVRGMVSHLAIQLNGALAAAGPSGPTHDDVEAALLNSDAVLGHLHAVALEWQLSLRLEQRLGIDPVVPPLVQSLIASPQLEVRSAAMRFLSAQARWAQGQRRMELALAELPAEQIHASLLAFRLLVDDKSGLSIAEAAIRRSYEEGSSRLSLCSRIIAAIDDPIAALDVEQAGLSLFVTALAAAAEQGRDDVLLSVESRSVRLPVALRASGLDAAAVERQVYALWPSDPVGAGFDDLEPDQAAAILAQFPSGEW